MKVYLSEFIDPAAVERLRSEAEIVDNFDNIEELDGIIVRGVPVGRDIIENGKNLKVIGRHGVGYEIVDVQAAKDNGVHVVNVPRANALSVAELVVARFLEMSKNLLRGNLGLRAGEFTRIAPPDLQGTEITGKTLGLIGMGNIPQIVVRMMKAAFNVRAIGYDPFVDAEEAAKRGIEKFDSLEEMLEQSDLVNISLHKTPETENFFSGDLFNHFKPGAIFVNTARGGIVNEDDLYEALKDGRLSAAAFDVFAAEPLSKDSKLLTLPNFSATPHIGGNTAEALARTSMTVVENVLHVIKGEPAEGIIV